jgi:thiamine pyrophosphate-dependent acetolactate synthase large subunit-like protein
MGLAWSVTVALRITRANSDTGTVLRVDGCLEAECLEELARACEGARAPLTLNLEGVSWIDDRAARSLRRLVAGGATVANASPYVALRLKTERERR